MLLNTNRWNRIRYTLYTPAYDLVGRLFTSSRARAVQSLGLTSGSRVLLVGGGTGLDLEFLPKDCQIWATDITPAMVASMQQRARKLGLEAHCQVMDGQQLQFPNASFDAVILHLIVAVIPDPLRCLQEAERVLKPGGMISVFDKFLPLHQQPSLLRKGVNAVAGLLFSELNRQIEPLVEQTRLKIVEDSATQLGGNYRLVRLSLPRE